MRYRNAILGAILLVIVLAALAVGLGKLNNKNDEQKTMNMPSQSQKSTTNNQSSSANSSASDNNAVDTTAVSIKDYTFTPATIKVKVGQTVTWTNEDSIGHSVIADTASADAPNGPILNKGQTYSFTFKTAGTYPYHCGPHPYMKGTVTVEE